MQTLFTTFSLRTHVSLTGWSYLSTSAPEGVTG